MGDPLMQYSYVGDWSRILLDDMMEGGSTPSLEVPVLYRWVRSSDPISDTLGCSFHLHKLIQKPDSSFPLGLRPIVDAIANHPVPVCLLPPL